MHYDFATIFSAAIAWVIGGAVAAMFGYALVRALRMKK